MRAEGLAVRMAVSDDDSVGRGFVAIRPDGGAWRQWAVVAVLAGVALLHGATLYASAGYDDTHITYWAAHALSTFGEIVNYNGERVEQSSSLLLVLVLAAAHRLTGLDLPALGAAVSLACGLLTIAVSVGLARRTGIGDTWRVAAVLAMSPYLVFWSFSGMETVMAALCVAWFLLFVIDTLQRGLSRPRLAYVALSATALIAVRPEAPFVALAFLGGLLVCAPAFARAPGATYAGACALRFRVAAIGGCVALIFLFLCAGRYGYFGAYLPQPVTAKTGGEPLERLADGAFYLLLQARSVTIVALLFLAAAGAVRILCRRTGTAAGFATLVLGCFVSSQLAFVLFGGGDWMGGARFLVPILPILAIIGLVGLDLFHPSGRKARVIAFGALLGLAAFDTLTFAARVSTGVPLAMLPRAEAAIGRYLPPSLPPPGWFERANLVHLRDIRPAAVLEGVVDDLRKELRRPVRVLSGQMGMVAFHVVRRHFGWVEIIDRRGLASTHLNGCAADVGLDSNQLGYAVTYEDLFRDRPELWSACSLPRPDVVFDLVRMDSSPADHMPLQILERAGYVVVYVQSGFVRAGWSREFEADEAILVHRDLIDAVDPARFARSSW